MHPLPESSDPADDVLAPNESGLDRRNFVKLALSAAGAAAVTGRVVAQEPTRPAQQPQQPPLPPLGNGEPPAMIFQPYPGGTGAYLEKLARERGRAAFERARFDVEPWSGPVPTAAEDIAFLPVHRLAGLIKSRKISSVALTEIYLERLKRLDPVLLC